MKTKKLPRLNPEQAWILNQKVMCNVERPGFEQIYEEAKRLNTEFIQQYWALKSIDVYLAITMRSLEDIQKAEKVCDFLEEKGFDVYNPGNNCESSRFVKHDLEQKMLSITKTLVMDAGDKDSGGKFIEACQAKFSYKLPVLFLAENEFQYKVYHDWHPMGILLGPHVCKSLDTISTCLENELRMKKDMTKQVKVEGKMNEICKNCESVLYRH